MSHHLPVDKKLAKSVAEVLTPILTDLIEFRAQLKHAHWNLRDINFISVHRLFDELTEVIDEGVDDLAERVRQLGQAIELPTATIAKATTLKPFPTGELRSEVAVTAIAERLQSIIASVRAGIEATSDGKTEEPITADLLTSFAGDLEKHLWLVDAHLP